MTRPRALDLFSGAGGAAMGLYRAGFDVVGVDIARQPRYPFPFIRGDALAPPVRLGDFDLVWASPPCQGYSIMRNLPWLRGREYPMLIPPVRQMLTASRVHFIIENVNQARRTARLPDGLSGGFLCGNQVGLSIFRHRRFESSFHWFAPPHGKHNAVISRGLMLGGRARVGDGMAYTRPNGMKYGFDQPHAAVGHGRHARTGAREAMGVEWMTYDEASQAIPPAYSEHIGRYALMALDLDPDEYARTK